MTLVSSMYTSANGLEAHSDAMNVVSDNIANVNTVGYKQGQARFSDIIAATPDMAPNGKLGQGSVVSHVTEAFTQGALLSTGLATDVALQGDGFFIVQGDYNGTNSKYYTRAGQFHIDSSGLLVNADTLPIQGYNADNKGSLQASVVGNISLAGRQSLPPLATSNLSVVANLDADAPVPVNAWDPANPSTTSNFSTSVTVYDSRGEAHNVDIYFRNDGSNSYEFHAMVNGAEVAGGVPGTPYEMQTGTLTFDTTGALVSQAPNQQTVDFNNATPGQAIAFTFGDDTNSGGTGLKGVTSYAATSTTHAVQQDGYAEGELSSLSITGEGLLVGRYTNGTQRTVGQLAVAKFTNNQGLERVGGTLYVATVDSGQAAVGAPGSGGRGSVAAGSLEQSNVNLSQEFINLMTYERGFQANTRTVHASDEMLQELVNLRR